MRTWGLALVLTMLTLFGIILLVYLCFRNGPYVSGTYDNKSLKKSFWHYRVTNMANLINLPAALAGQKEPKRDNL